MCFESSGVSTPGVSPKHMSEALCMQVAYGNDAEASLLHQGATRSEMGTKIRIDVQIQRGPAFSKRFGPAERLIGLLWVMTDSVLL